MDEIEAEKKKVKSQKLYTYYELERNGILMFIVGFLIGLFAMYVITKI